MKIAKRLAWFSVYTCEEEEDERFLGVSTKLNLSINGSESPNPWKIKKTLEHSNCDHICRLMLRKDTVHNQIIKVWEDAGKEEEIAQVLNNQGGGVAVKVWDYERGKEYELNFKKLYSSQCYILSGAWSNKFVKERRLNKGDIVALYWSTYKSSFVFSVRARAPTAA
ncbi:TF-B3 domain-containing protein [Heracleum sosnowskyi]|uniref:TF-B3 domain-containing protein n=1 Tax=Heracleum sosnowskyi TaxID=360622 RepID=A0AAD8H6Z5_9APIA|nr:TF-B3 domain-containing protein [Heracleum sosnowskyi]